MGSTAWFGTVNEATNGYDDLTLGERLMVARERCGLTKIAVARIVLDPGEDKNPRSQTIGAWERESMGLSLVSLRRLTDLYEKVGSISPSWVILGDGPMMNPGSPPLDGVPKLPTDG